MVHLSQVGTQLALLQVYSLLGASAGLENFQHILAGKTNEAGGMVELSQFFYTQHRTPARTVPFFYSAYRAPIAARPVPNLKGALPGLSHIFHQA